ncbi:choice-of-anchor L domain-containing protein [Neolewinella lacunae]|uniref:Choice-of-anchor L domain-containing protein n=1 Tax=Neolewinella lacunae TaxID=1517758 RepID=A0A923PIK2_9BACT|nr:choice-of-anchor L domain-containing protein [Neolewinella lacunae]MBC6994808.1 choice-of-anchor L domain-containing protein [Neolewinella lacunae]MDN3634430.1 choice-of-anchor L domain-containing protein [Neolewinella lacunae]
MRLLLLLLSLLSLPAFGQTLELDADFTAERLVKEVFASGQCETIFNIRQIGANRAGIGSFSGPEDIVGFGRGIVLSTGRIVDAAGPNTDTNVGSELEGRTDDPDLSLASTGLIYDRSGIEFDFIPLQPTVTFRYVFASEEYCEFVGEQFNDIFGFFISGPGINGPFSRGAINLATIPGTNQAVSINNVNFATNRQFYLDNEFPSVRQISGCGGGAGTGPRFQTIEYDGQTVILTATVELQTCATYHIRLLVGDVQDSDLDSAVFLEAGSFDLGGSVSLEGEGDTTQATVIYEGCAPVNFRVQRGADSNPARPQTIAYRIGSNSVATEGVDFSAGTGTVTIPAGAQFAEIPIEAFADGNVEGPENVWLYLDIPCACYTDSIELIIDETAPLVVGLAEAYYCPDEMATLNPEVSGGAPPYSFVWSFGSTDPLPTLTPPLPPSIELTVSDACGQTQRRTIATFSSTPPGLSLPPQNLTACRGEDQSIALDLTGVAPITVYYRLNNGSVEQQVFDGTGRQQWPIDRGGNYRLFALEDRSCRVELNETVRADFFRPSINPRLVNPTCSGDADGSITVTHLPTVPPYTYTWTGVNPTGLSITGLPAGAYSLRVTDALGCSDERNLTLRDPDALQPVEITCNEVRRPPLTPSAEGGRPPYQYSINGVDYWGAEGFVNLTVGEFYRLRIRDAAGCELLQPDFFWPEATARPARLPSFVTQELAGSVLVEPDYRVPPDQIVAYRWYPPELFDCPSCPNPTLRAPSSQTISLAIDNRYACTDSLVTFVTVDGRVPVYVPNAFSPNGDGTNDYVAIYANTLQVELVRSFRVFTRWGEEVYSATDFLPNDGRMGWDGYLRGKLAAAAAYVWVAEVQLTTGELQRETGTVVLMVGRSE